MSVERPHRRDPATEPNDGFWADLFSFLAFWSWGGWDAEEPPPPDATQEVGLAEEAGLEGDPEDFFEDDPFGLG